jgi:hypothetical protein
MSAMRRTKSFEVTNNNNYNNFVKSHIQTLNKEEQKSSSLSKFVFYLLSNHNPPSTPNVPRSSSSVTFKPKGSTGLFKKPELSSKFHHPII